MRTHLVIPDTQVKPGVPVDHLRWIGCYIVDQFAGDDLCIVHLGDHWDMPSLSSYDRGKRSMEGRRYVEDVAAGNEAWRILNAPLEAFNAGRRATKHAQWWPERHLLRGNHEYRIARAAEDQAEFDGLVTMDDLQSPGWTVHDFLEVVEIDGVHYSHFFAHPMTGRPYGGQSIDTRLKTIGCTFTMGHQQTLMYGLRHTVAGMHHGLVAGACYLHREDYLGPQGNDHWRGLVVCHAVRNGSYCPMFVDLDYLCRRYEGVGLETFTGGLLSA